MPEFDVTVGNHDTVPLVTVTRVYAANQRAALREAFTALQNPENPSAWHVIDVKEVASGAAE